MRIQIIILIIVITSLVSACAKKNTDTARTANTEEVLAGTWVLTEMGDKKTNTKSDDQQPQISINLESKTISGNSGCNRISGSIKEFSKTSLVFGPIAATKRMCAEPNHERQFLEALKNTESFILDGGRLTLVGAKNIHLLSFEKDNEAKK